MVAGGRRRSKGKRRPPGRHGAASPRSFERIAAPSAVFTVVRLRTSRRPVYPQNGRLARCSGKAHLRENARMTPLRGVDLWADLARWLRRFKINTAFDVGANVGQSAVEIVRHHPECRIWCFEPVAETCRVLRKRMEAHPRCETHPLALGSRSGRAPMAIAAEPSDSDHPLAAAAEKPADPARVRDVEVVTLDDFAQRHSVPP